MRVCKKTGDVIFDKIECGVTSIYRVGEPEESKTIGYTLEGMKKKRDFIDFENSADLETALGEISVQFMKDSDNIVVKLPFTPEKEKE